MSTSARPSFGCATAENQRLGKLLRLALVADQPGEIIGAIHALKRSLGSAGLDPHYIADAFERGTAAVARVDHHDDHDREGDDTSAIWFAFHRRYSLTPRDRQFIEGLTAWHGPLSPKQRKWLFDVLAKLDEAA